MLRQSASVAVRRLAAAARPAVRTYTKVAASTPVAKLAGGILPAQFRRAYSAAADAAAASPKSDENDNHNAMFQGDALKQSAVEARLLFEEIMADVNKKAAAAGKEVKFPKEILWLGGAPGSGKGTNTAFIMRERHITTEPIVMSDLLNSPEARAVKAQGGMVGDKEVVKALMMQLQEPKYAAGVVVDGFPRTKVQADIVRCLYDNLMQKFREDPTKNTRPVFRIVVLYVEQAESIARQLARGQKTKKHNEKVLESGEGVLEQERDTDFDPNLAKKRYRVFKESTYEALEELGKHFTYNLINAQGSYAAVEANIKKEMEYQSGVELNPETFTSIRHLPRASEVVTHARQALVRRLDQYVLEDRAGFQAAVDLLKNHFYPEIERHVIAGQCRVLAQVGKERDIDILMDILSDRGFRVVADRTKGNSLTRFEIMWERPTIRRLYL